MANFGVDLVPAGQGSQLPPTFAVARIPVRAGEGSRAVACPECRIKAGYGGGVRDFLAEDLNQHAIAWFERCLNPARKL